MLKTDVRRNGILGPQNVEMALTSESRVQRGSRILTTTYSKMGSTKSKEQNKMYQRTYYNSSTETIKA